MPGTAAALAVGRSEEERLSPCIVTRTKLRRAQHKGNHGGVTSGPGAASIRSGMDRPVAHPGHVSPHGFVFGGGFARSRTHWYACLWRGGGFYKGERGGAQHRGSGKLQIREEIMRKTALVFGLLAAVAAWPMAQAAVTAYKANLG